MKFPPIAIWVALFALLACAADGRGFGLNYHVETSADVCAAQAQIASFSSELPQATSLVCDIQRALGAMDGDGTVPPTPGATTLLVTVDPSRVPLPSPTGAMAAVRVFYSPALTPESSLRETPGFSSLTGTSPGLRFSYRLAPHAPPQAA